MNSSAALRIRRVTLSAGIKTAVIPPITACNVSLLNNTAGDLEVHTTDGDDTEYLILPAGYERTIPVDRHLFVPTETAFWVKSAGGGLMVVLWF